MCRVHAHGDARASTARERVIRALRTSSRPRGARLDGRTRGRPRRDGDGGALVGAATTMKSTMKSSSPLRPRARATAIALALAALCASFVPTARAQNNFYALEELQTPPAVRERRSRRPARALPSPRVASVAPAQTAPFPPRRARTVLTPRRRRPQLVAAPRRYRGCTPRKGTSSAAPSSRSTAPGSSGPRPGRCASRVASRPPHPAAPAILRRARNNESHRARPHLPSPSSHRSDSRARTRSRRCCTRTSATAKRTS